MHQKWHLWYKNIPSGNPGMVYIHKILSPLGGMGKFSPIGQMLLLATVLKITAQFFGGLHMYILFSNYGKVMHYF
jgi:hypothetical protein